MSKKPFKLFVNLMCMDLIAATRAEGGLVLFRLVFVPAIFKVYGSDGWWNKVNLIKYLALAKADWLVYF